MFKVFKIFYDAPSNVGDASGNSGKNGNLPADVDERKVLDQLDGKEDDKSDDGDGKDKSEESDDEKEEDLTDEDDLKDDDEEDEKETEEADEDDELNLDDQDDDQSLYKRLKGLDKDIFKKAPELRSVLFREQEFTKTFATIDEAKQASDLAETFIKFQSDIESGDAETLILATKELGEDTLKSFSGNFLPALLKADQDTYYEVIQPELKRMLRAMGKHENEDIRQSAKNINWALWGNTDLAKDEGFSPAKKDPKEDKLTQREVEFEQKQLSTFAADVQSVATKKASRLISKSLEGFELTNDYQEHLVSKILKRALETMDKDVRYSGQMKVLWGKAKSTGYTTEGKESLINTFLSRAKGVIPKIRQQVLTEAKLSAKKESDDKPERKATRLSGNNSVGTGGKPGGRIDPKKVDWDQTTDRDVLEGKVTLRK